MSAWMCYGSAHRGALQAKRPRPPDKRRQNERAKPDFGTRSEIAHTLLRGHTHTHTHSLTSPTQAHGTNLVFSIAALS